MTRFCCGSVTFPKRSVWQRRSISQLCWSSSSKRGFYPCLLFCAMRSTTICSTSGAVMASTIALTENLPPSAALASPSARKSHSQRPPAGRFFFIKEGHLRQVQTKNVKSLPCCWERTPLAEQQTHLLPGRDTRRRNLASTPKIRSRWK